MTAKPEQIIDFELQPNIENELIKLRPLRSDDLELLYKIASDPLIWEQHPNKDRYKKDVFETFFKAAIESNAAFLVFDNKTAEPIGSSRYYEFNKETKSIAIGYTFLARDHWGMIYNRALKSLMLEHAFKFVNNVVFHVGVKNIRSQKAIEKLRAKKIGEEEREYYDLGQKILSFKYRINKEDWLTS